MACGEDAACGGDIAFFDVAMGGALFGRPEEIEHVPPGWWAALDSMSFS